MKKIILCWLCIISCVIFMPMNALAVTAIDIDRDCSLTLSYSKNDAVFDNLDINIFRVAQAFYDGTYELISPYSSYPVNIHGITSQKEWDNVADTLSAYISAQQVQPYQTAKTDENGVAAFSDLETGLYLVSGVMAENEDGKYVFENFMIYLPTPINAENNYEMDAKPKCSEFVPKTEYKVVKLWQDVGHTEERPVSVTVDVLKDGAVYDTVVLNTENNWTYSWNVYGDNGGWSVVENDVPEGYNVTISQNEATFTIINTYPTTPDIPDTGDTSPIWLYIIAMCISGMVLIVLSIGLRKNQYGKAE